MFIGQMNQWVFWAKFAVYFFVSTILFTLTGWGASFVLIVPLLIARALFILALLAFINLFRQWKGITTVTVTRSALVFLLTFQVIGYLFNPMIVTDFRSKFLLIEGMKILSPSSFTEIDPYTQEAYEVSSLERKLVDKFEWVFFFSIHLYFVALFNIILGAYRERWRNRKKIQKIVYLGLLLIAPFFFDFLGDNIFPFSLFDVDGTLAQLDSVIISIFLSIWYSF